MNKTVKEWEIIDHGIENSQSFQGCGTAYTRFDYVDTGCGESAKDAFNDALESVASRGVDVKPIEESEEGKQWLSQEADYNSVTTYARNNPDWPKDKDGDPEMSECEMYYYLSIRWNQEEAA